MPAAIRHDYRAKVADELRDQIAAVELRVVARRSSARFRDNRRSSRSAVSWGCCIPEGRLDRKGDRVLVSVELVDAVSGFRLWSHSYDRPGQDLMLVQQALANDVLGQLMPRLAGQAQPPPPSLQQVAAHDLLLLGRQYEQQILEEQRVDLAMLDKVIGLYRAGRRDRPVVRGGAGQARQNAAVCRGGAEGRVGDPEGRRTRS
jgi:hypothetical protein